MPSANAPAKDDLLTLISISAIGYVLQDVLHEGLGHGVVALLSGAHQLTMSTVALQSDIGTRAISAAGTIVNVIAGAIFWLILRRAPNLKPVTRYFLVVAVAGNLFSGTGYFFYSGVTNFGDWAAVIRGLEPHWAWRAGLIVFGMAAYYGSMLIVWATLIPFLSKSNRGARLRLLCWTTYFTAGAVSAFAGLLNPAGLFYVIASALPSTLGANVGFFIAPFSLHPHNLPEEPPTGPIPRSIPWIVAGAIASLFFIVLLGRGISWSR